MEYNDKKVWSESPEELTARDNLPDYRTPQDLGLSEELNREWAAPDLRDVCRKNLGEK